MPDGANHLLMLDKAAVNRYLLAKSHLLPDTKLDSVGAVLRDLAVLDANGVEDAYFSLYLRVKRFDVMAFEKGLHRGTSMARVKGLKNYMQIVPQDYLPAVYTISKGDREASARNLLSTWGITEGEYREVGGRVLETLEGKEKTLVQLKRDLGSVSRDIVRKRREKAMNVSIVAQAMQDRWVLLRGGIGRHPGESPGRFSIFKDRLGMKLDMDRDEALSLLAKRYVRGYGPVCAEDLAWWLGITPAEAGKALGALEGAAAVEMEGVPGRFFMDKKDEPLVGKPPHGPSIVFLPKDDPYVKAYYDEARFVPEGHRAMTKFGESASVVLIDGAVWGTWRLEKGYPDDACIVTMYDGCPDIGERRGLLELAALDAGRFYTGGRVKVHSNI